MTDVVAVGLITGFSGLLVGVAGSLTTYKVSKNSSATAIKTAESAAEVERERLEAESRRLQFEVAESERRKRSDLYQQVLSLHTSIFNAALSPSTESLNEEIGQLHALWAAVQLTDAVGVRSAMEAYVGLVSEFAEAVNEGEKWHTVAAARIDELRQAANGVAAQMRMDISLRPSSPRERQPERKRAP